MPITVNTLMNQCLAELNKQVAEGYVCGSVGICDSLYSVRGHIWVKPEDLELRSKQSSEFYDLLKSLINSWPERVHPAYPVPAPKEYADKQPLATDKGSLALRAFGYYATAGELWVNEYGDSRKRLLAHMTAQAALLP